MPGEPARAKTPEETKKYVSRILAEASKSLFDMFEPVDLGEDWRYDGKRSFGKGVGREFGPLARGYEIQ